jgi:hypothetical protein
MTKLLEGGGKKEALPDESDNLTLVTPKVVMHTPTILTPAAFILSDVFVEDCHVW